MCCSLTARKLINNSLTSLNANPIIFINYHLPVNEPYISANHFHQQHLLTMLRTKKKVLKDGAVISPPQPPQPPSPSRFIAAASAICSTAARVAATTTSVLTSPGKTTAMHL
jgi:hypothetical protein